MSLAFRGLHFTTLFIHFLLATGAVDNDRLENFHGVKATKWGLQPVRPARHPGSTNARTPSWSFEATLRRSSNGPLRSELGISIDRAYFTEIAVDRGQEILSNKISFLVIQRVRYGELQIS